MQTPSIGRTVHYRLSADEAARINRRRTTSGSIADRIAAKEWPRGAQAHVGNTASEGEVVPMIVTKVWPEEYAGNAHHAHHATGEDWQVKYESAFGINGQLVLDGTDSLWVTSAPQHPTLTGCWFWPPRD
jgi:hypothetical protein